MALDFVLANVRLADRPAPVDIGFRGGLIAAIETALPRHGRMQDGAGRLAFPGFVECHIHLDKVGILERCAIGSGTLQEAVTSTKAAKAGFSEDDVYARAAAVIEQAIGHGTTSMRTFVEIDAQAGLRSFKALTRLREDYAGAIKLEICAFAQDGTTGVEGSLELLAQALQSGADLVGGCPYTDSEPARHIADIFDLAERFDMPVDFHIDFSLDPAVTDLPAVIAETHKRGYMGRVSLGHVTNLSMLPPDAVRRIAAGLAAAGIGVVALPATDLFLMGRDSTHAIPRGIAPLSLLAAAGVTTAIATNNVLNPFTPFGNASLMRMTDLYIHAGQLRTDPEIRSAFDLVSSGAAAMLGKAHELVVGAPATLVLLDAADPVAAIRGQKAPLAGWYRGNQTFVRSPVQLFPTTATSLQP
jgi:cytosine deaminase